MLFVVIQASTTQKECAALVTTRKEERSLLGTARTKTLLTTQRDFARLVTLPVTHRYEV
jgi:hypothetical protein